MVGAKGNGNRGNFEAIYHYDALGRRLKKEVIYNGYTEATSFIWQGLRLLQSQYQGDNKRDSQLYIYESDSSYTPIAMVEYKGDIRYHEPSIYHYHTDINGQPLDTTGDLVWSMRYDDWGKTRGYTNALYQRAVDKQLSTTTNLRQFLRYAGQYLDAETELHYNTFRYYAPEVGRFTTQDPIGLSGGINLYAYAPNPLGWIDPLGLCRCDVEPSKPNHKAGTSSKKYGHASNHHGSQKKPQQMKDKASAKKRPQGHFSDNAMIEEAFEKAPTTAGEHVVTVSKPSTVYYPDGSSKSTNLVKIFISERKGPVTAYPYILGD